MALKSQQYPPGCEKGLTFRDVDPRHNSVLVADSARQPRFLSAHLCSPLLTTLRIRA